MTIARDPETYEVLGQVCDIRHRQDMDRYGHYAAWRTEITLLTKDGQYVTVPTSSVRLEELR